MGANHGDNIPSQVIFHKETFFNRLSSSTTYAVRRKTVVYNLLQSDYIIDPTCVYALCLNLESEAWTEDLYFNKIELIWDGGRYTPVFI